ncbi:hypothetical protein HPL003_12110 [Paenibacillus terrae HPL-003]|uniref:Cysteine-rich VLP domain-containing protein n=1 Tax=Paenibacillus terrae (strain HPL-003) TaxID=985665 RepID=G7W1Z9_PAETH|nr:hypothetical protein [Paenibacillus terrae]AET59179.1 hypothetical protein HPL003_12110 [Paenibacillus terrae HPL-003]
MQNKNRFKRLVKNNCACYLGAKHGISNYCCLQDSPCVFFAQDDGLPRCTYFENGVLPMDEKLDQEYTSERNVKTEFKTAQPRVNCQKCGTAFSAHSNRQKYCEKCRDKNANEKTKLRMRQIRKKQA